jgi:hypothetical protein
MRALIQKQEMNVSIAGNELMKPAARLRSIATCFLLLGTGVGAQGAQVEASPALEQLAERTGAREGSASTGATEKAFPHEAIVAPLKDRAPEYADKVPPARVPERPGDAAPGSNYQWLEGYWDWDTTRREFVWVTGTWRVSPPGKFWVDGFWRYVDDKGWKRVPGFWSERRATPPSGNGVRATQDWKRSGPPPRRPVETVGPAPAPDFFYVPGEFIPEGEGIVWRPGFWYRSQPGWEWNPAHWVRRADGWAFRDGSWSRNAATPTLPPGGGSIPGDRTVVSTPAGSDATPNGNGPTPNILLTSGSEDPSGASTNAAAAAPAASGTTLPNLEAIENRESDAAPADGETPSGSERSGQKTGTKPTGGSAPARAPVQTSAPPRYYYPQQGGMRYYSPMGGVRFGLGYISQFLPF